MRPSPFVVWTGCVRVSSTVGGRQSTWYGPGLWHQNWTTSDLALTVTVAAGPRFGARLQAALREAVRDRRLHPDDALPVHADAQAQLGVARGTVVGAYEQLVAEGYLVALAGGRTTSRFLATATAPAARDGARPAATPLRPASRSARPAELPRDGLGVGIRGGEQDGAVGGSGLRRWARDAHAREVVAAHLRRVRAADAEPDSLLVANGFAQCVSLVVGVLASRGVRTLAVEDPGDRSVDRIAGAAGIRLVPIPVDGDGMLVDLLAGSDADAVLITPAHQSPTGAVLSAERRIALTEWAAASGGWIVEDDYD